MKNVSLKKFLVALVLLFCMNKLPAQQLVQQQPNIIVITTDEQSADAMSYFMGKKWINTPGMDKLAEEGVVFTKAYAAYPLCAPSRNSIITGLLPHQTKIQSNADLNSAKDRNGEKFKSMGTYFKDAGYETAYFGKWHLNYKPKNKESFGFETTKYTDDRGNDAALPALTDEFLKSPHKKPFLLFLSFINPHDICEWARFQKLKEGPIAPVPPLDELPHIKVNSLFSKMNQMR
jgi:arylsulfatase A-like enzyme